ncbi:MAG: hypothetical protein LIO87_01700 [Eubacterium sp.]|nr:hypothetical protein [Eubacterium sp.]
MEVLDERVLAGFGIEPKYIRKVKYMYIVKCSRGSFVIRKADADSKRIMFVSDIKNGLKRKGFRRFFDFEAAVDGKPYFELEGANYIMTPSGRDTVSPEYTREGDFREILRSFGAFHRAGAFGESPEFKDFWGEDIKTVFSTYEERLKRMRKQVYRKRRLDDIDYIFLKNYEYYYRACEESLEGLEKFGIDREEFSARNNGKIVLNNADEETMALYPTGVFFNDMLKLEAGTPLKDLRIIINRFLKKNRQPILKISEILEEYGRRSPLSPEAVRLLYYMLIFPERYIKTYWDYYKKGRAFTPVYVKDSIKRMVEERERDREYIEEIKGF